MSLLTMFHLAYFGCILWVMIYIPGCSEEMNASSGQSSSLIGLAEKLDTGSKEGKLSTKSEKQPLLKLTHQSSSSDLTKLSVALTPPRQRSVLVAAPPSALRKILENLLPEKTSSYTRDNGQVNTQSDNVTLSTYTSLPIPTGSILHYPKLKRQTQIYERLESASVNASGNVCATTEQSSPSFKNIADKSGCDETQGDEEKSQMSGDEEKFISKTEHNVFQINPYWCKANDVEHVYANESGIFQVTANVSNSLLTKKCVWTVQTSPDGYISAGLDWIRVDNELISESGPRSVFSIKDHSDTLAQVKECKYILPRFVYSSKNDFEFQFDFSRLLPSSNNKTLTMKVIFNISQISYRMHLPVDWLDGNSGYVYSHYEFGKRNYPSHMNATATIWINATDVLFVSFPKFSLENEVEARGCLYDALLLYAVDVKNNSNKNLLKTVCGGQDIETKVYNSSLQLMFTSDSYTWRPGFKMYFTIHPVSQTPEKLVNGTFNCSVPFYASFEKHLKCNMKIECDQGQDEKNCDYTNPNCGPGKLHVGDKCLMLFQQKQTWYQAVETCNKHGAKILTLRSSLEWKEFRNFLDDFGRYTPVFLGLSGIGPILHQYNLYRKILKWTDNSIAYYVENYRSYSFFYTDCVLLDADLCRNILPVKCDSVQLADIFCESNVTEQKSGGSVLLKNVTIPARNESSLAISKLVIHELGYLIHDFLLCQMDHFAKKHYLTKCEADPNIFLFQCDNKVQYISYTLVCDHTYDCADSSDETHCTFQNCTSEEIPCRNQQCIARQSHCDEKYDCVDGSDEMICPGNSYAISSSLAPPAVVELNGLGQYTQYPLSTTDSCPETHFQCPDGYCLPVYLRCNDVKDCLHGEDEVDCNNYLCSGFYLCRRSFICLHVNNMCDGVFQCPMKDDELLCNLTCPKECMCQGLSFVCAGHFPNNTTYPQELRYLNVSHIQLNSFKSDQVKVINSFYLLTYLSLSQCKIDKIPTLTLANLKYLDLSMNNIINVNMKIFYKLKNLQVLNLSKNPIQTWVIGHVLRMVENAYDAGSLVKNDNLLLPLEDIDLSLTKITTYNSTVLSLAPNLKILNMSNSLLDRILNSGFNNTPYLEVLDLRNNSLNFYPIDMLKDHENLKNVYADNFKICCPQVLPNNFNERNCYAGKDKVSSCDDLLQSNSYRFFLWIFCLFGLTGNVGSFICRFRNSALPSLVSMHLFVTNLCVADFLMGVYLAIIGIADAVYRENYYQKDIVWRESLSCQIAGFLSFLSCEVSSFFVCLITLDRFIVFRSPFSQIRFRRWSAMLASTISWAIGFILATVPFWPIASEWQYYSQTGICIPLPITSSFRGKNYSFSVMIVFNFVLFFLIFLGQVSIYRFIQAGSSKAADKSKKKRDITIAKRLAAVVLTNFLCWFPIGLLGILSSAGMAISDDINVAMAIFVLPFNATLNPFLYTFSVLISKRNRLQKSRLLERLEMQFTNEMSQIGTLRQNSNKESALKQIEDLLRTNCLSMVDVEFYLKLQTEDSET